MGHFGLSRRLYYIGHEKTNEIMRCESQKNASQSGIQSDIRTSIMPHISTSVNHCIFNQSAAYLWNCQESARHRVFRLRTGLQ